MKLHRKWAGKYLDRNLSKGDLLGKKDHATVKSIWKPSWDNGQNILCKYIEFFYPEYGHWNNRYDIRQIFHTYICNLETYIENIWLQTKNILETYA